MYDSLKDRASDIRDIFERDCSSVQSWDNDYEMTHKSEFLCECVNYFQREFLQYQKPLLMQTIWKTQGLSPILADQAFDIIIWSDYAFSRLFVDKGSEKKAKMSRPMRATARLARCLWELSKSGKIQLSAIYRQMAYDNQTDKEFSIPATRWREYVQSDRVLRPILPKNTVFEIASPESYQKLSPERRFDQTLYFTMINNK